MKSKIKKTKPQFFFGDIVALKTCGTTSNGWKHNFQNPFAIYTIKKNRSGKYFYRLYEHLETHYGYIYFDWVSEDDLTLVKRGYDE